MLYDYDSDRTMPSFHFMALYLEQTKIKQTRKFLYRKINTDYIGHKSQTSYYNNMCFNANNFLCAS